MVRTFCMLVVLAAPAAPAAAQERDAELFAGAATEWSRETLAVDDFEDTPTQVPARTAASVDAGTTFTWSRAALLLELGARGGDVVEWSVSAVAGPASLTLTQETEGGPRTSTATGGGDDGVAGGLGLGARAALFGDSGWWIGGDYRLELGYAGLDNATLFGGTPIEGTARWLRHDAALRVGWDAAASFTVYTGTRAVWSTLSTQWELAFDVPGVARDTDAQFTTRHPMRWLVGTEWRAPDGAAAVALELSAGRLPTDVAAALRVRLRF